MNWKNRLTNYNFWISMFSAVLLILQALKIEFDIAYVNEIFTAVLGLLVVIGIISDPTRTSVKTDSTATRETKKETIVETSKAETIPTNEKNEINNDNLKNDIQAILKTITENLDEKIKDLEKFNLESINKLEKKEIIDESTIEDLPAVAEIDNPYVDVNN